jgi:hypothetical protein
MDHDHDPYDIDLDAYLARCVTAIDGLAKLKAETDLADDDEHGVFLTAVEDAIDDLVFARLRVSARLSKQIILNPECDPRTRQESVQEFAAFNTVLDYYGEETVIL